MGEYAKYRGESIKIGTCEDMYYLRWDQAHLVTPEANSLDPVRERDALRFRFPFPDEDTIEPGQFDRYDRAIGLHGISVPDGVEHRDAQFVRSYPASGGYNVMLPCPESTEGKSSGLKFHRNGFAGEVLIKQQAWRGGRLVLIAECGGCGAAYRYPEFADVELVVVAIRSLADREQRDWERTNPPGIPVGTRASRAEYYDTIADRITAGYTVSVTA